MLVINLLKRLKDKKRVSKTPTLAKLDILNTEWKQKCAPSDKTLEYFPSCHRFGKQHYNKDYSTSTHFLVLIEQNISGNFSSKTLRRHHKKQVILIKIVNLKLFVVLRDSQHVKEYLTNSCLECRQDRPKKERQFGQSCTIYKNRI